MANRKDRRKNLHQQQPSNTATAQVAAQNEEIEATVAVPEPGAPFPPLSAISPARLAANRANAQHSTGPNPESFATTSQNRTTHGLARHTNGLFQLTANEDPAGFEAFKQSLIDEHAPTTPTESILVDAMAESHWLGQRAQRLQDTCVDPATGKIADEKKFSLYLRYQTTHTRAFHKSLNDLLKLRAEKRKADRGFEAQSVQNEKHEMKKQTHYWDVLKKDAQACNQISANVLQNSRARAEFPGFEAEYAAELKKHGLQEGAHHFAATAA
jgi:hypothetical protein